MIVVTGATGLVGGNLLWLLLQQNERVGAIRRATSNLEPLRTIFSFYTTDPDTHLARIDWKIADILDVEALTIALSGASIVYHCAAVVSLGGSSDAVLDINVVGTKNVVDISLQMNIQKLCFVSSIAACGHANRNEKIDENTVWHENAHRSMYSKSKYYSELEVWRGIHNGLKAVIVNPGVILGVSGSNTGSSQLFAQVRKGLQFYSNGGSGYVDVQDVTKAMVQLTNSDISGERYILIGENCSNKDILNWIADGFDKPRPFICISKSLLLAIGYAGEMSGRIFHFKPLIDSGTARSATNRAYYSSAKIEQAIGIKYKPVRQCVTEICKFMLQQNY